MTSVSDHCRELADRVQEIFSIGFQADAKTVDFINSTLGCPGYRELQTVLGDDADSDREGLIDLIVAPDLPFCCRLEELLSRTLFSEQDMRAVLTLLPENLKTSVRMPGMPPIGFVLPESCRRRFLDQLRATRHFDAKIRKALERHLPDRSARWQVLVKIRHSRSTAHAAPPPLLLEFIRLFRQDDHDRWFDCLDVVLELLTRSAMGEDLFEVFLSEKRNLQRQVDNTRLLAEKLSKNNMETLMMQGCRPGPAGDIPALLRRISLIDHIFLLIWEKIPAVEAAGTKNPDTIAFLFEKDAPG